MAHLNDKTSLLVNRQLPEFVREDYPLFITFLEAYYEFLETKQGTQLNDLTTQSKSLQNVNDVDHAIAQFESSFFNSFATLLPRDIKVDKEFLIKNVLPLYLAKGNEKSFKLLFRMLFNDEVDIVLPKDNILKASDGKWVIDNVLKVETDIRSTYVGDGTTKTFILAQEASASQLTVTVNGVAQVNVTNFYIRKETKKIIFSTAPAVGVEVKVVYLNFEASILNNRKVTGVQSGATAIIERATKRIITDTFTLGFPYQLFINSKTLVGTFTQGEQVTTDVFDANGNLITISADTFSIVNKINIITGGSSYNVGDQVPITGGGATVGASATVSDVIEGYINRVDVTNGGAGFVSGGDIYVSGIAPLILDLAIGSVDTSGVANSTSNTYTVSNDIISTYSSILINAADYGFPSPVITNQNAATSIVDALTELTLSNLGPITNVAILFSNTATSVSPTLVPQGALYSAGSSSFSIKPFKSVGKINITAAGSGYKVGEEIVFTNPVGTDGQGAAAAIKAIGAGGTITQVEIQPSRIAGTVAISNNSVTMTGTGSTFGTDVRVGDKIIVRNQTRTIASIASATSAAVNTNLFFEGGSAISTESGRKVGRYGVYPLGGQFYDATSKPTLTITTTAGSGATLVTSALMSDNSSMTPFIGTETPGEIVAIDITSGGTGYSFIPQVVLTGSGNGLATANAEIESVFSSFPGRWTTSDSIISSSERKLADARYYTDFSYVTSSLTEFTKYKKVLRDLLHPSGYNQFADLNFKANIVPPTITYSTATQKTLSGLVNVAATSVYVLGSNTKFNVATSSSIISIGAKIAVNNEIRIINAINSNTNLSVTAAFTNSANVQTVILQT